MEKTDLRTEFTKETKARFNVEWVAYNDYVDWLEQRLVKLLTIPPVSNCIAIEYAEFCVRCDREKLPLLCLEDYIKQYCC